MSSNSSTYTPPAPSNAGPTVSANVHVGGPLNNVSSWLAGAPSNSAYNAAPQVTGPNQSAYQIGGLNPYINTQQGLSNQVGGLNGGQVGQQSASSQQALAAYLQNIAMGNAPSAADQMLQNSQNTANRQMQGQLTSAQGLSPALAMRQMFNNQAALQGNIAGQSALQKLQEQQTFGQMAGQANQAAFGMQQQQYANSMSQIQAQNDIANNIFNANRAQTSYNVAFDQNQQAYQQYQRQQYLGQQAASSNGFVAGVGAMLHGASSAAGYMSAGGSSSVGNDAENGGSSAEWSNMDANATPDWVTEE